MEPADGFIDGFFQFTMTYPVADSGLLIAASNPPPDEGAETAAIIVAVEPAPATPVIDEPEELALTGVDSVTLATAAAALIAAGAVATLLGRRRATTQKIGRIRPTRSVGTTE